MSMSRKILCYVVLIAMQTYAEEISCQNISQNTWFPRSFSSSKTREMISLHDYALRKNILSFSMEYAQNFGCHDDRLGSLPFWSGTNTMTIGTNDGKATLDAYQFGMGDVLTEGSITLNPKVQSVGGELLWRVAYDEQDKGPFFQVKVPIAAMSINPEVSETVATLSADQDVDWTGYPAQSIRFKTLTEALINSYEHREPDFQFGRLCAGKKSVVRCADIEAVAGYHFYSTEKGFFSAGFKVSVPTGNVPNAEFLLEPIVGRGGHWGLGAELAGNGKLYSGDCGDLYLSARGDVLHLTSGRAPHWRSFDLKKNGVGSKYLMVQRYVVSVDTSGDEVVMPSDLSSAINITTLPVISTFSVEGSVAVGLTYEKSNWHTSLIGEVWGRSAECLRIDCDLAAEQKDQSLNDYAVLGRQIPEKDIGGTVDLYYCEPLAKINKSATRITTAGMADATVKDARLSANRIPSNYDDALDIAGAQAPYVVTGKVTAEAGYCWKDNSLEPHVSVFGSVEFANQSSKFENLWSVGLQGSLAF